MALQLVQKINDLPVDIFIAIRLAISKCLRQIYWNFLWTSEGSAKIEHLLDSLFRTYPSDFLLKSGVVIGGKKIPSLIEACQATLKRFLVLEEFFPKLKPSFHGIILGGSMSYGAFHSVRDSEEESAGSASDMDIVLVAKKMAGNLIENFGNITSFVPSDIEIFCKRFRHFQLLWKEKKADIISQKFPVASQGYDVSLHLFPFLTLKRILGKEFWEDLLCGKDLDLHLLDYRLVPYPHDSLDARNFSGEITWIDVSEKNITNRGFINPIPAYVIRQGRYYPSVWHNLISPEFQVIYDTDGKVSEYVRRFRQHMKKRAREEGLGNHDFRNSHIRSPAFQVKLPF